MKKQVLNFEKISRICGRLAYQILENNINEEPLNIFPNPTSDIVTINGIKSLNDVSYIHLLDNKGTLLKNIGINDTQVDLTSFTAGIYFIKIKHQLGMYKFHYQKNQVNALQLEEHH